MRHVVQRYVKEKVKQILSSKLSSIFCHSLSREETRALTYLEPIFKTNGFELDSLKVNGSTIQPSIKVNYPDSILFKANNSVVQTLRILPSGGICNKQEILCTGFTGYSGRKAYNVLGYLQSFIKKKKVISGVVICNWPQQFLTYGDFILQLLPELCLIKASISEEAWTNAHFVFPKPTKFIIEYLKILGCNNSQIVNSSNYCFDLAPNSNLYFREKDPMWFLSAPLHLLQISRDYFRPSEKINQSDKKQQLLFVERLGGYRQAIGLDDKVREKLSALGVSFFNPTDAPINTQIETFANAEIVIGVHGAGIANILWCRQGAKVVEIFHPKFAPWCYAILANQLNMDYYCIGGQPGNIDFNFRKSDVEVDWNYLIKLIHQLKSDVNLALT